MTDPAPVVVDTPPGWAPNGAPGTSAASVAVVGILVWGIQSYFKITVPPDVIIDLGIVAAYLGSYLHPAGRS